MEGTKDAVRITVSTADLIAQRVQDSGTDAAFNAADGTLSQRAEDAKLGGAFVPFNNDDDDDDDGTPDFREALTGENAGTAFENDLLPITISPGTIDSGQFDLIVSKPDKLKIWRDSQRNTLFTGSIDVATEFDEAATVAFFVEAINGAIGKETIKLQWRSTADAKPVFVDKINVRIFTITGPTNVPGDTAYTYTANGGINGDQSVWLPSLPAQGQATPNGDSADIQWEAGPFIGKARYQASPDYVWARDVNVVQIEFDTDDAQQHGIVATPNDPVQTAALLVNSALANQQVAMAARIHVSNIQGPTRGGDPRGVDHLQLGFIQNLTVTEQTATYKNSNTPSVVTNPHQGTHSNRMALPNAATRIPTKLNPPSLALSPRGGA